MKVDWIAVDWGTSNLRIWALDSHDNVLAEKQSNQGMAGLLPLEFEQVLLEHIEEWLGIHAMPIRACGMVGARQGWCEAPYASVPTAPTSQSIKVPAKDQRLAMRIISGVSQANPADVMRGEETQIAGFLSDNPDYHGVLCMPGTHSKWVQIQGGQIVRFQTAMTGEIFGLLSQNSVLRHSMGDWDEAVFLETIIEAYQSPELAMSNMFSIRARDLLEGDTKGRAKLSANLVALEISGMRQLWQEQQITIIGTARLAHLYELALKKLGQTALRIDGELMSLKGLIANYRRSVL